MIDESRPDYVLLQQVLPGRDCPCFVQISKEEAHRIWRIYRDYIEARKAIGTVDPHGPIFMRFKTDAAL